MPLSHLLRPILSRVEGRTLLGLLLAVAALWGFGSLAAEMAKGDVQEFDRSVLLALRAPGDLSDPIGPRALEEAMRDLTALGGAVWLIFLSAGTALALCLRGRIGDGLVLAGAVLGGQALTHLAKFAFARPRPDLVPHGSFVYNASFPSGHSTMAAVTYLTLAVLIARAEPRRRVRAVYVAMAVILTIAVGVSRVYLGVHWPSDVAAGWMMGAAWALLCALLADRLGDHPATAERQGSPDDRFLATPTRRFDD